MLSGWECPHPCASHIWCILYRSRHNAPSFVFPALGTSYQGPVLLPLYMIGHERISGKRIVCRQTPSRSWRSRWKSAGGPCSRQYHHTLSHHGGIPPVTLTLRSHPHFITNNQVYERKRCLSTVFGIRCLIIRRYSHNPFALIRRHDKRLVAQRLNDTQDACSLACRNTCNRRNRRRGITRYRCLVLIRVGESECHPKANNTCQNNCHDSANN